MDSDRHTHTQDRQQWQTFANTKHEKYFCQCVKCSHQHSTEKRHTPNNTSPPLQKNANIFALNRQSGIQITKINKPDRKINKSTIRFVNKKQQISKQRERERESITILWDKINIKH